MRRRPQRLRRRALVVLGGVLAAAVASAQGSPAWGRVSIFGQGIWGSAGLGGSQSFNGNYSGSIALHAPASDELSADYGLEVRAWNSPLENSDPRVSIFEAFVGGRTQNNTLGLWAGQLWMPELGGLGSIGGVLLGVSPSGQAFGGRFRFALFGGVEPKLLEAGNLKNIKKTGGYISFAGAHALQSSVGYVLVKNGSMTERSTLTMINFIPIGNWFMLYQAGEYDLVKPGGLAPAGLNYIFVNARVVPSSIFDVQVTYHKGRSIDARTITDVLLNGRAVDPRLLDGFLFESLGARVNVQVAPMLRIYGGYAREKGNVGDPTAGRATLGLFASNLFRTGFDFTVADNRYTRSNGNGNYDSWYASLGRSIGPRVYLSADYSTSLSVVRFTDSGGVTVETHPKTRRAALTGTATVSRVISLLLSVEELWDDQTTQQRGLAGLTFRF